jgi:hypothetical protein
MSDKSKNGNKPKRKKQGDNGVRKHARSKNPPPPKKDSGKKKD